MPSVPNRPILCLVTDSAAADPGGDRLDFLAESIRVAASAGIDWIQIREKDLLPRELLAVSGQAVAIANQQRDCRIIINGRLDVALAAKAAGVHLGSAALPALATADWVRTKSQARPGFLIGASTHSLAEATEREASGADYIFFGPVFDTPSKRQFGAPQGVERLKQVCSEVKIPVIAIGGIDLANARHCFEAGASGIAAIRLFQSSADWASLAARIAELRKFR